MSSFCCGSGFGGGSGGGVVAGFGTPPEYWVDPAAPAGGDGTQLNPFQTPQEGVDAAVAFGINAGLIHLTPGNHDTAVAIPGGVRITFTGSEAVTTVLAITAGMTLTDDATVFFFNVSVGAIELLGASGFAGANVIAFTSILSIVTRNVASTSVGTMDLYDSQVLQYVLPDHVIRLYNSVHSNVLGASECGQLEAYNNSSIVGDTINVDFGAGIIHNSTVTCELAGGPGSITFDAESLGYFDTSGGILTGLDSFVEQMQYPVFSGTTSSAALAGTNNDYDAFGLNFAARLNGAAGTTITSITNGYWGRAGMLTNTGSNPIAFSHNTGGTAANRILCPGSVTYNLAPNDSVWIWYDVTSGRWRLFGNSLASTYASQITAAPAANQNDYAPTGWSTATNVLLVPTTPVVITGFAARAAGSTVTIKNRSTFPVVFMVDAAASTAANRISAIGGVRGHIIVLPGDTIELFYNGTTSRWNVGSFTRVVNAGGSLRDLIPNRTSAGPVGLWLNFSSNGGTWTAPTPTTADYPSSLSRTRFPTTAGINVVVGLRSAQQSFLMGNGAGLGGFAFNLGWGITTFTNNTPTFFMGLNGATTSAGANDATTLTDMVGFGLQGGDGNWQFMTNNAAGAAAKVDLGASYARNATNWFNGWIYADPNTSTISYAIWRMDDLTVTPAVGNVAADLPTVAMQIQLYACNLAEANVQAFDFNTMILWTPS